MRSKDPASEGNVLRRLEQDDSALRIRYAEHENFGTHWSNLSRRKIHHGDDKPADQLLRLIVNGQLRAGASPADGTKVDQQLVGGFAGLGKRQRLDDAADAHLDALEIRDANGGSLAQRS